MLSPLCYVMLMATIIHKLSVQEVLSNTSPDMENGKKYLDIQYTVFHYIVSNFFIVFCMKIGHNIIDIPVALEQKLEWVHSVPANQSGERLTASVI